VCSLYAWVEFAVFNSVDVVPAWIFSDSAIIGWRIFTIPIEDVIFPIVGGIGFYWSFYRIKHNTSRGLFQKANLFVLGMLAMFTIFVLFQSGIFGKYTVIRMIFGLIFISVNLKYFDILHFLKFTFAVTIFAFLWDLWALNTEQWQYRLYATGQHSKVFSDKYWFLVHHAWFNIEVFYFYVSGAIFGYGVLFNQIVKQRENPIYNFESVYVAGLSDYLQEVMDNKKITIEQLAQMVDIEYIKIYDIVHYGKKPSASEAKKIDEALDLEISKIY
jgi:hypothetical protein